MPLPSTTRRRFLADCATALGGAVMVGAAPDSIFAVLRPAATLHDEFLWSMGTQVRLSIPREVYAPQIIESAFGLVREVDSHLSVHRATSELELLNRDPDVWHVASRPLLNVAEAAIRYGDVTGGALDVTVLPVLRRLGFAPAAESTGAASKEVVDYTKLRVSDGKVLVAGGGYAVDFGGIAKGFAVDEAISSLRHASVPSALVDAGGDLYAMGRPESDRRWRIGIRDPFRTDALFATLEIEDEAVATSGIYAQTRTVDGATVSHIIDPATCNPVDHVASATVVTRNTMKADALATSLCVMDPASSMKLVNGMEETEALWVFANGSVAMSEGMRLRVTLR